MYESITYDVILKRMLDRLSAEMDKRESTVIWDTLSPTAIELQILYLELDNILKESYGDTASREFLIRRCKERGITPYKATSAILKGVVTPDTIDVTGQRFSIDGLTYTATKKVTGGFEMECETAGAAGNQPRGALIPISYIEGLEAAKLTELLIPGEDVEDTEALRGRYFASFDEKAFGGNKEDYLIKVNAIPGVGGVKVTRVWNGDISPSKLIPTDKVKTWYDGTITTLHDEVAAWLSSVYQAAVDKKLTTGGTVQLTILNSMFDVPSETLIQTVQTAIDPDGANGEGLGLAPIGHMVSVQPVQGVEITIRTTITFGGGSSWDNLQKPIEDAMQDYLLQLRKSWAGENKLIVRIAQIETRILTIPGVIDIAGTTINGAAENLTVGEYEVPVFKAVSA